MCISEEAKNVDFVNNLQKAYAKRIDNLEWMSPTTKEGQRKVIYITKLDILINERL
jgi:putative endopeptidase